MRPLVSTSPHWPTECRVYPPRCRFPGNARRTGRPLPRLAPPRHMPRPPAQLHADASPPTSRVGLGDARGMSASLCTSSSCKANYNQHHNNNNIHRQHHGPILTGKFPASRENDSQMFNHLVVGELEAQLISRLDRISSRATRRGALVAAQIVGVHQLVRQRRVIRITFLARVGILAATRYPVNDQPVEDAVRV